MSASLEASLRLEIAQYQAALAKAQGAAKKFKENIKREGDGLGGAFLGGLKGQLSGLLPALGASAVVAGLHGIVSAADDLADASVKLGTTPATFQRVQAAAEILGGTDMETVTSALVRLRRQLIDDPGSALAQGLKQVGVETESFLRLDADEQLVALADAFARAQQDGVALPLLTEAFGKSFKELIPLLAQGGEAISGFYGEVVVASDVTVTALAAANDRIDGFVKSVKNWATEAFGAVIGLGKAIATGGQSLQDEQAAADAAAMAAMRAREAQADEAIRKRAAGEAKAATKAAGLAGKSGGAAAGGDPFADTERASAKLAAAEMRLLDETMTKEERIASLKERIASLNAAPVDPFGGADPAAGIERETQRVELQTQLNRLLKEQDEIRQQAAAAIDEEAATEYDQFQKQQAAVASLREQAALLQARAAGNDDLVAQMERELRIREKAAEIEAQTGATAKQAREAAAQMIALEDQAAARSGSKSGAGEERGNPGHIRGVGRRRMMGGYLEDFDNLQRGAFGAGSLSQATGPISERARRNADAADARGSRDTSATDLGGKIYELLQRNLD